MNEDSAYITFFLFTIFRDTVGRAIFAEGSTNGTYRRFSAAVEYEMPDNPYQAYFVISPSGQAAPQEGGVLFLDDMEIVEATGIGDKDLHKSVAVFPGVVRDKLQIRNSTGKKVKLSLYDINGREVYEQIFENGNHQMDIPFSNGIYLAKIEHDGKLIKTLKLAVVGSQ